MGKQDGNGKWTLKDIQQTDWEWSIIPEALKEVQKKLGIGANEQTVKTALLIRLKEIEAEMQDQINEMTSLYEELE